MPNTLLSLLVVPGIPTALFIGWIHLFIRRRDRQSRRPFEHMSRPAGWSLQQRTSDLGLDCGFYCLMATTAGIAFAGSASIGKGSPWLLPALGLLLSSLFFIKAACLLRKLANYRLGLLGEQVVGRILDGLSSPELKVFHDIEVRDPGKKPWNIDHIVVTPAAVFAIETKTRRKPRDLTRQKSENGNQNKNQNENQNHKVTFDGNQLIFPAPLKTDRRAIDQAASNADWLSNHLTKLNGEPIPVLPVLVLPGWWVDRKGKGPVAIMNPEQLPGFFSKRPAQHSDTRFKAIAGQLDERSRIDLSAGR